MKLKEEEYLAHYGILRKSGRYPWGSGGTQNKRNKMFLDTIEELKQQGMSDTEIARGFSRPDAPFTLRTLRELKTIALAEQKQEKIRQIERLAERGWSNVKIGERMGLAESTVRSLRSPHQKHKLDVLQSTADMLKRQVDEKGAIDIGTQVERALPLSDNPATLIGISSTKFRTAVTMLKEQGYKEHTVPVPQLTLPGQFTRTKVLARPDVKWSSLVRDPQQIKSITEHTEDGGEHYTAHRPPTNISSKRIKVNYAEDGGGGKDGLIEIRPGAKDLDLGRSRYAQVRIAVDKTHYLKGMAVYNPDLPAGTDIRFNTSKSKVGNKKHDVMKPMEKDELGNINLKNPFNAAIKPNGQRGALNIIYEQGDWDTWSKTLPSQMLSKQSDKLAKTQLDVTYERRRNELNSLKELTNPAVKRKLLDTFADETDSSAVHMEAAARVGQTSKVLIPVTTVKPNEIYSPSLPNGTRVALVRFPHGGTFEIPEVTVNNKNPEARKLLGTAARDAVAVHHTVAERLSGADFDGDHVLVIPNNRGEVKSSPALQGLKDFDPRSAYAPYDGMKTIDGGTWDAKSKQPDYGGRLPRGGRMQQEMGKVTNLITDMTIHGANSEDKARAVRHSMVIIDAEKHSLDFKASEKVNAISDLKRKYQGVSPTGQPRGASTLLSRATADARFPMRVPRPAKDGGPIDKKTGKKVFVDTGETYVDKKTGKVVEKKFKAPRLAVIEDAHTLSSGTTMEDLYADHSNRLKALGNEARKESVNTKSTPMSKSAKNVYKKEVESLDAKLSVALKNAPLERQAQAIGNSIASQKRAANPNMSPSDIRRVNRLALEEGRYRTGAHKTRIELTQDEWNAIQAGAISNHQLESILRNAKLEPIRKFATPKQQLKMTSSKTARAKTMLAQGYTLAEVADNLGVALSTLKIGLDEGGE